MNTFIHEIERKRHVNAFNSYHMICDLCGCYHNTRTCMQVQNMDYYDEFGCYNPYFNQYGANWSNSHAYGWDNQYAYNASPCFYDY